MQRMCASLADVFPALSGNGSYPLQPLNWSALSARCAAIVSGDAARDSRSLVPEQWHKLAGN